MASFKEKTHFYSGRTASKNVEKEETLSLKVDDYTVTVPCRTIKISHLKKLVEYGNCGSYDGYLMGREFVLKIDGKLKNDDDDYDPFTMLEIETVMTYNLPVVESTDAGLDHPPVTTVAKLKDLMGQQLEWAELTDVVGQQRNWAEIPCDALSVIFKKLGAAEVLLSAQAVCRSWRQHALDHTSQVWRCIDMRYVPDAMRPKLTLLAVDRSSGHAEKLYAVLVTDGILSYIADRTTKLRCLALVWNCLPREGLGYVLARNPLLEELSIHSAVEFSDTWSCNKIALEIANNMPRLQKLHLIRFGMTNKGLDDILDKCPRLEFLDIRCCFELRLDRSLKAKLRKVKNLRLSRPPPTDEERFWENIRCFNGGTLPADNCYEGPALPIEEDLWLEKCYSK